MNRERILRMTEAYRDLGCKVADDCAIDLPPIYPSCPSYSASKLVTMLPNCWYRGSVFLVWPFNENTQMFLSFLSAEL